MDIVSAERRLSYLLEELASINKWIANSSGISETALRAFVEDTGKVLNEKRDLIFRIGRAKAITKFDKDMTILEAECYIESMIEMVRINENVAFGLSKFVLGGAVASSNADVMSLYKESSSMLASIFEMEERLRVVKTSTNV